MKVKVRRSYLGAEGRVHRGDVLDIPESRFRQLTEGIHARNPLVDAMEVGFKMEPLPKNKMEPAPLNKRVEPKGSSINFIRAGKEAAKDGTADPTPIQPAGGPTGAENPASSSEPDHQRVKRKYTRRKAEPA